jgi:hypothetical protein
MEKSVRDKLKTETIIKDEPAQWIDSSSIMQSGRLTLTKKHLVFALNDAKKAAIVIDLDTINAIKHEDLLTDHNILAITYLQYDVARFSVLDFGEWEKTIEEQRMVPHIKMS